MPLDPKDIGPETLGTPVDQFSFVFKAGAAVAAGLIVVSGWDDAHPTCINADSGAAATTNGTLFYTDSGVGSGKYGRARTIAVVTLDTSASSVGAPVYVNLAGAVGLSAGATSRIVGRVASVGTSGKAILSLGA